VCSNVFVLTITGVLTTSRKTFCCSARMHRHTTSKDRWYHIIHLSFVICKCWCWINTYMHHFNGHFHVVLTIKIVIHCQRTLRGEGQSVDSWGIYGSVLLHTAGPKSICSGTEWPLICTVLHTANAGQYATLNCEPPLFGFPCKWQYINVLTFEPLNLGCWFPPWFSL